MSRRHVDARTRASVVVVVVTGGAGGIRRRRRPVDLAFPRRRLSSVQTVQKPSTATMIERVQFGRRSQR